MSWLSLLLLFALADNVLLARLLGVAPTPDAPGSLRAAAATGLLTAVLVTAAAIAVRAADALALAPLGLGFLRTPASVMAVVGAAAAAAVLLGRAAPRLLRLTGASAAAMAANSAVLGSVLVITRAVSTIGQCIVAGLAAGAGYGAVLLLLAGIRRRLEIEDVPASMRGLPLELVSAGLLALAFLAFDRAFLARVAGG